MAADPNALNAQLFKSQVGFISLGVYFLSKVKWGVGGGGCFRVGFFLQADVRSRNVGRNVFKI